MDRFTKIALASAIALAFSAQTNAAMYTPQPTIPIQEEPFFSGFYFGVGAGVVGVNGDVTTTHKQVNNSTITVTFEDDSTFEIYDFDTVHKGNNVEKYGFNAMVFAGFGQVMDPNYYLGGELFANYFSPDAKYSFDGVLAGDSLDLTYMTTTKIKNKYSYGGDIRLGYLFFPKTMFYVLFGVDYAKFKVNSIGTAGINSSTPIPPENTLTLVNNFSKNKFGYTPGIGIEFVLNKNDDNFTLRAEYRHTFYSSFERTIYGNPNSSDEDPYDPGQGDEEQLLPTSKHSLTTKVKPNRGVFSINLSYYLK
jgi:opacity protein-like surface antigen